MVRQMLLCFAVAVGATLAGAAAGEDGIRFTDLDSLLRDKPLQPGGPSAEIVATRHVDASELQIVVARKIELHTHEDTVHLVYVARGSGVFRFAGEAHPVKVGDILTIPKHVVHGFEAQAGAEPLVLLVVETPG